MSKRTGRVARKSVKDNSEPEVDKRVQTRGTKETQDENIEINMQKVEQIQVEKENNQVTIKFGKRAYNFDLNDKYVKKNKKLVEILQNDIEKWLPLIREKAQKKNKNILKITDHFNFSAVEYFFYLQMENIERQQKNIKQLCDEEKCCICQCELYEGVGEKDKKDYDFEQQLKEQKDDDCVGLEMCDGHYFHEECLINCVEYKHIKCPICSRIYGIMQGDQPDGNMKHRVDKNLNCAGYDCGTIIINYHFPSGVRNGKHYSGTGRSAYLPDNEVGRECLELLKIGFERKLLFTIGRSVTTGQDNTTVWNGVHHKTNTSGGPAYFGYPDPTYFDRLKLELAMKGVYAQDNDKNEQKQQQNKDQDQDSNQNQKQDSNSQQIQVVKKDTKRSRGRGRGKKQ